MTPAEGAQPRERERGIRASGDDEVHLRRQVVHEKGEGLMDSPGSDDVVVIEDEGEVCCSARYEVIGQQDKHRLKGCGLWRVQKCQRRPPNRWIEGLQGGDDIGEKAHRLVVLGFEREPGSGRATCY